MLGCVEPVYGLALPAVIDFIPLRGDHLRFQFWIAHVLTFRPKKRTKKPYRFGNLAIFRHTWAIFGLFWIHDVYPLVI